MNTMTKTLITAAVAAVMIGATSTAYAATPTTNLRTVLSLLPATGGNPGTPGAGGAGHGGVGINFGNYSPGGQINIRCMGFNGPPGSAHHG